MKMSWSRGRSAARVRRSSTWRAYSAEPPPLVASIAPCCEECERPGERQQREPGTEQERTTVGDAGEQISERTRRQERRHRAHRSRQPSGPDPEAARVGEAEVEQVRDG